MRSQKCEAIRVDTGTNWSHYMWPHTDEQEMLNFLRENDLMKYAPRLKTEGIYNLRDLANFDHEDLKSIGFGEGCLKARKTIMNLRCKLNFKSKSFQNL